MLLTLSLATSILLSGCAKKEDAAIAPTKSDRPPQSAANAEVSENLEERPSFKLRFAEASEFKNWWQADDFQHIEDKLTELRKELPYNDYALSVLRSCYTIMSPHCKSPAEWDAYFSRVDKWRDAFPKSISPRIVLAGAYVAWAWSVRGSGFASTVSDKNFEQFHQRLEYTGKLIEEILDQKPHDPEIYAIVLNQGVGSGADLATMMSLFDRGTAIDPNYERLYATVAQYLLPRWHGNPGDLEAFADRCAEKFGPDKYFVIAAETYSFEAGTFFLHTKFDYQKLKLGFDALRKRMPNPNWYANFATRFACENSDYAYAHQCWPLMGKVRLNHAWPKGNEDFYQRVYSGPLPPDHPARRIVLTRTVSDLAYSPDGSKLLVCGDFYEQSVRIYDAANLSLRGFANVPNTAQMLVGCFSPNGQMAVFGGKDFTQKTSLLYLRLPDKSVRELPGHKQEIRDAKFSPSGDLLATCGADLAVRVWKTADDAATLLLNHPQGIWGVCFIDDNRLATICQDKQLRIWDANAGTMTKAIETDDAENPTVRYCPTAKQLACTTNDHIEIFDVATWSKTTTVAVDFPMHIDWSPDGKLIAAASRDCRARIFDAVSGKELRTLEGGCLDLLAVRFSPDGKQLLSAGQDGAIDVWNVAEVLKK